MVSQNGRNMVMIKAHIYWTLTMSQVQSGTCCSIVSFILDNNQMSQVEAPVLYRWEKCLSGPWGTWLNGEHLQGPVFEPWHAWLCCLSCQCYSLPLPLIPFGNTWCKAINAFRISPSTPRLAMWFLYNEEVPLKGNLCVNGLPRNTLQRLHLQSSYPLVNLGTRTGAHLDQCSCSPWPALVST